MKKINPRQKKKKKEIFCTLIVLITLTKANHSNQQDIRSSHWHVTIWSPPTFIHTVPPCVWLASSRSVWDKWWWSVLRHKTWLVLQLDSDHFIVLEPDNKTLEMASGSLKFLLLKINNGKSGPGRTYGWCSGSGRGQQEAAATIRRAGSSVGTGIKVSTIYYDSCNIKMKSISTM